MHQHKSHGFTLIELIIALALSAFIVGLLAISTNIIVRDWEQAGNSLDEKLDLTLGLVQIEQAIQGAYPHSFRDREENKEYVYFEGDEKSLSWVSTVSPSRRSGLTAWRLERDGDGRGVELFFTPAYADSPEKRLKDAEPTELFEDYRVYFEYLDIDPRDREEGFGKSKWREKWLAEDHQALPYAVRMRLEAPEDEEKPSLEIIALILANEHKRLPRKQVRD